MEPIVVEPALVSYCGLYCGACGAYRRGRCPGCHENHKATWCKVRTCCRDRQFASCADCTEFPDPKGCGKYNNVIARLFGFVFRSDRAKCITQIRSVGLSAHAADMAARGRPSMPRD